MQFEKNPSNARITNQLPTPTGGSSFESTVYILLTILLALYALALVMQFIFGTANLIMEIRIYWIGVDFSFDKVTE